MVTCLLVPALIGCLSSAYQSQAADRTSNLCGPLALRAAFEANGERVSLAEILAVLPAHDDPKNLLELKNAAEALGLQTRALSWGRHQQAVFPCPAVIRIRPEALSQSGHFVVVMATCDDYLQILDLPYPAVWIHRKELHAHWDGDALYLSRSAAELPSPPSSPLRQLPRVAYCCAILGFLVSCVALARTRNVAPSEMIRSNGVASAGLGLVVNRKLRTIVCVSLSVLTAGTLLGVAVEHGEKERRVGLAVIRVDHNDRQVHVSDALIRQGGGTARLRYNLRNTGGKDATITRVTTSCACADVAIQKSTIAAQETVSVLVDIRMDQFRSRTVVLVLDFDHAIPTSLRLTGTVKRDTGE
jgi:hypothetical protein